MRRLAVLAFLLVASPLFAVNPTLVQHVAGSGQEGVATTIAWYNLRLPNVVGSGNAVIVGVAENCSGGPPCTTAPTPSAVSDDKGNVYTLGPSRAGINNKIFIYYSCNITNGPRTISVKYASAQAQPYRAVVASEYYNVATACLDTSSSNCSSISAGLCNSSVPGTTLTTGSITTTVDSDLIWSWDVADDTSYGTQDGTEWASWTPQGSFNVLNGDIHMLHSTNAFVETTHGTNNYNVTTYSIAGCAVCANDDWVTATLALKSASQGTAPTVGAIHVDRVYHTNVTISWCSATPCSAKQQIPRGSAGNLIILTGAGEPTNGQITSVSDGTNTWAAPITYDGGGNVYSNLDYTSQPTSTDTAAATWTYAGAVSGGEPVWIFVVSNASINAPFDKHILCTGNDTGGSFNVTITCNNSITPVQNNELLVGVCATFNNAEGESMISAGPSPAVSVANDSCSPLGGANCATSSEIATSPIDENDCASIAYLTSTATVTPTWVINNDTVGTGAWSDIHALFEQAPAAVAGRTRQLMGVGR